ncbi:MAG: hypothetical protein HDR19_02235 [Lachnospiraceae bacterium]|nr:hypothetical protein [Lachnospiraceae bacterium]
MKLVIGGYAQGKLNYVLQKYQLSKYRVYDGTIPAEYKQCEETIIVNHFHQWVRDSLLKKGCPEQEVLTLLDHYDRCVIISSEIGNGIVPIDPFEREYRECVGKILITIAERADEVERVICGIGQRIK